MLLEKQPQLNSCVVLPQTFNLEVKCNTCEGQKEMRETARMKGKDC